MTVDPKAKTETSASGTARKREILRQAVRMMCERGYHAMSMRDLAGALGMKAASLYYYFESKEELLGEALQELATAFTEAFAPAMHADAHTHAGTFDKVIHNLVHLAVAQRPLLTIYLRYKAELPEALRQSIGAIQAQGMSQLVRIYEQGRARNELRNADPERAVNTAVGAALWVHDWLVDHTNVPAGLEDEVTHQILSGAHHSHQAHK